MNDLKTRADHEKCQTIKDFWQDCTYAYNDFEDEDDNAAFKIVLDTNNIHFDDIFCADIHNAETMTVDIMQKKVSKHLKVQKLVQKISLLLHLSSGH